MHLAPLSGRSGAAKMEAASEISGGDLQKYTEAHSGCQGIAMSTLEPPPQELGARPRRADARRNYEKVLAAARDAFAEGGEASSLEEIARRAGGGVGTLDRHFPTRQALLEAVYLDEVEALCRSVDDLAGLPPWDALARWLK